MIQPRLYQASTIHPPATSRLGQLRMAAIVAALTLITLAGYLLGPGAARAPEPAPARALVATPIAGSSRGALGALLDDQRRTLGKGTHEQQEAQS